MSYDAWKTRSDWDDNPDLALGRWRGEAEVDPEELQAEQEYRQNIQNLLEQEEPAMGEESEPDDETTMTKGFASLDVETWLKLAELAELIELRDRINTMIGARVPSVTKTRKPRSDRGQSNPKRGRKRS